MKKNITLLLAVTFASCMLCSSCIGSFELSNRLLSWNKSIDNKYVNEMVFVAFWIMPVYEISMFADLVVFNSIEFWTDENPVADAGSVKTIESKDGVYTVETSKDGYTIRKEGEENVVDLNFDSSDNSWSVEAKSESCKLLKFINSNEVVMFLPDGREMSVPLNEVGVLAFKQVINQYSLYASR